MENTQDLLIENQLLKKAATRNNVILLTLFILTVCSAVFAYTQRIEARQQKERSDYLMEELLRAKADAEQAQIEASVYRDQVVKNQIMDDQALQESQQKNK